MSENLDPFGAVKDTGIFFLIVLSAIIAGTAASEWLTSIEPLRLVLNILISTVALSTLIYIWEYWDELKSLFHRPEPETEPLPPEILP